MSFSFNVTERDLGLEKLKDLLQKIADKEGTIGVKAGVLASGPGGAHEFGGKLTVAEIAAVHEFGSKDGRLPERSFMRATIVDHRQEYIEILKTLLIRLMDKKINPAKFFDVIGLRISSDMRKKITVEGVQPPNTAATIRRKSRDRKLRAKLKFGNKMRDATGRYIGKNVTGKETTLVDTAQLLRAITYARVLLGGAEVPGEVTGSV